MQTNNFFNASNLREPILFSLTMRDTATDELTTQVFAAYDDEKLMGGAALLAKIKGAEVVTVERFAGLLH